MQIRRRFFACKAMVVLTATIALILVPGAIASAAAGDRASCVGHEASSISPPGSSEEFSGGMPELRQTIAELFPGVPVGLIYSSVAKVHAGSHEECDAALG